MLYEVITKFFQFLRSERFDLVINALWMSTELSGFLTFVLILVII